MKTQFYYCDNEILRNGFGRYGLLFSQQFCEFFATNFTKCFFEKTGLKPSSKVTIAGYKQRNDTPIYQPGLVSKLNLVLWIMPYYNDNISFCWNSKNCDIVKPTDENFNEVNIECWIEGLKPAEYWKLVATEKKSHPFQMPNLPFDFKVFDFGTEMIIRIYTKLDFGQIKVMVSNTIQTYNEVSESNNRKNGVVHNYKFVEDDNCLTLQIDSGSAGLEIIKRIIKQITKIIGIEKVELDV